MESQHQNQESPSPVNSKMPQTWAERRPENKEKKRAKEVRFFFFYGNVLHFRAACNCRFLSSFFKIVVGPPLLSSLIIRELTKIAQNADRKKWSLAKREKKLADNRLAKAVHFLSFYIWITAFFYQN